jgi:exodeoxyribonuclease X
MLIRVVDLETTGLEPPAMPVELGWCDIKDRLIFGTGFRFFDPGHPIPPECSAIHHIVDDGVKGQPSFDELTRWEADVYVAHSAQFEAQWLTERIIGDAPWVCTYKCALRLWPEAPSHSNQALRYWLRLELNPALAMPPHRAGPDAYITAHIFLEMLHTTPIETLIAWSREPAMLPRITFGKHSGSKWSEIPEDYLRWMTNQRDMDPDSVFCAQTEIAKREAGMPF